MAKTVAAPAAGTAQPSTPTRSSSWAIGTAIQQAVAKVTQVQQQTPTAPTGMTPPITAPGVDQMVAPPSDQPQLPYLPQSNAPKYAILGVIGIGVLAAGFLAYKALK